MDYTNEKIGYLNRLYEGSCEQNVDCDITLPDYCPDISRVIKCCILPNIISSKLSGDRLCIDGDVLIKIIYADEDNALHTYEQSSQFSKFAPLGNELVGTVCVTPRVQYSSCRALSKRKLEVHSCVSADFKISAVAYREIVTGIPRDNIQIKSQKIAFSDVVCFEARQFTISEKFELPPDYLPAHYILSFLSGPIITQTKAVRDKVLIKGEVAAELIYIPEGCASECVKYNYSLPVNQVVTCEGVDEDCEISIQLDIMNKECCLRCNELSQQRVVEISCCMNAVIKAFREKEIECISDAYCTDSILACTYEQTDFIKISNKISESTTQRMGIDLSGIDCEKICCIWPDSVNVNKTLHSGTLGLHGTICFNIIACDDDGRVIFCQREADFNFEKAADGENLIPGDISVTPTGFLPGGINDGKTEIKGEFIISAELLCVENKNILCNAEITDKKPEGCSSFIIYFPDENESIWDIARKYSSTVSSIKAQNSIKEDFITCTGPILIPVIRG